MALISFVVPAHNEEASIGSTLDALMNAAGQVGDPFEIIVVNDSSTDETPELARGRGARVIDVQHRHIAATRNSGGREARGDFLFFLDADTEINATVIHDSLEAMRNGAIGGGCHFEYDGPIPFWAKLVLPVANWIGRAAKITGGACLFCRREAFFETGGFCERYYAAEDVAFVKALKLRGKFHIPRAKVRTSGRKFSVITFRSGVSLLYRLIAIGPESFLTREGLDLWYGPEARSNLPRRNVISRGE